MQLFLKLLGAEVEVDLVVFEFLGHRAALAVGHHVALVGNLLLQRRDALLQFAQRSGVRLQLHIELLRKAFRLLALADGLGGVHHGDPQLRIRLGCDEQRRGDHCGHRQVHCLHCVRCLLLHEKRLPTLLRANGDYSVLSWPI